MDNQLDETDRRVIYELMADARGTSAPTIAEAVDVSPATIRNRIDRLEDRGVITGYRATVDYDEAGIRHYYMFVCSARVSDRESLAEQARPQPSVTEVITLMTGTYNVDVVAAGNEKRDISDVARNLDTLGLEIEREHLVWRHDRQPFSGFELDAEP